MKRTFRTLLPLGSLLVAAACSDTVDEPAAIQNRLTLTSFGSCEQLEQYVEDEAVRDMKSQLDCMKSDGWCGFGFRGLEAAADTAGGPPNAAAAGPTAYTKTNVQVAGVDEADFMKNDGTRIFVISGQKLHAVKSWPADQLAEQGTLSIEGYPTQMYLDEKNRVVVFSSVYTKYDGFADGGGGGGGGISDSALCAPGSCYYGGNTTKVTVVDVSNLAALKVTSEYYLPGNYANSRRIDSSVRLVLSDYFRWPVALKWYPTSNDQNLWQNPAKLAVELDRLKVENEALIRAQSLAKWLPLPKRKLADGRIVDVQYDCKDFSRSNGPVHMGLVTVATLNLDNLDAGPSRTSVVGQAGEIYASKNSLYIATPHWWWWPAPGQKDYTYFHKFDLGDKNKALYVASGGVDGHIVDQFSMDESKGFFRVATTISSRVPDTMNPTNRWGRIETTNRISVLREDSGRIVQTGTSEDIATGERITSSRFVGDRAFIVTFRNIDPLFTFDLSNPSAPRRVGELKIPGFSSYIHPLDENHLLTVGTYLPDPGTGGMVNWQERRLQLSIFDVTNFANPVQSHQQLVGTAYGWSEANWDHHAFNYFPERKLLAIPFSDYVSNAGDPWGRFVSELKVFGVDTATGFSNKGALSLKDVYVSAGTPEWYYWYSPWVRRSVMSTDNTTDFVYAVSDAGIRVATAAALGAPLATVVFKREPWKE